MSRKMTRAEIERSIEVARQNRDGARLEMAEANRVAARAAEQFTDASRRFDRWTAELTRLHSLTPEAPR